ncbi:MAG: hypothetical protein C0432_02550 [Candidatus Puniceispirillum sp.]|nr:hypothetical protein [Candidatus Pelagibacter sp.]MBA4283155.1 hypothetical protein [Candidatus Puniceispirillum sp.]
MQKIRNMKIMSYPYQWTHNFSALMWIIFSQDALALCEVPIQHFENNHKLPKNMLRAMALVESGRTIAPNVRVAWPWTINVDGQGHMYHSKGQAIQAVKDLMNKGKKSIDVGCMQINLKQHPEAFSNLDSAFDPHTNVSYAVKFLKRLYDNSQDWLKTIGHYHSKTEKYGSIYQDKVLKTIQIISDVHSNDSYKNLFNVSNVKNHVTHLVQPYSPKGLSRNKQIQPAVSKVASMAKNVAPILPIKAVGVQKYGKRRFISFASNQFRPAVSMRRKFLPLR